MLLILVLMNLLWVSSCARLETVGVLAKVIALDGTATVVRKGETTPRPLSLGQRLAPGDMIRSSEGASVTLSLVPGIRIVLLGGSEILLERLEIRKSGEAVDDPMQDRRVEVALASGSLYASVGDVEGETDALLSVTTSAGNFDADSGSIFFLRADASRTHVACAEEQLKVRQWSNAVVAVVDEGQSQEFGGSDMAPAPPMEVQAGSPEAEEIANALDAERKVVDWEHAASNQIPALAAD